MKTKIILLAIVAVSAGLISLNCTNTIGNGSDIGNAVVVGKLYDADGVTPAAGVRVHIRPKKSLADTSGVGLIKRSASLTAVDSVVTDNAGRFAFDSTLDTGTYVIEAVSGNNAVLIDSVKVKKRDSTDTLPPDTLKPTGALKGVIKLSEGGDTRKVFVLAFGIDRFARVEADGRFKFQNLAEAAYDLRIISSLDDYGVLDTNAISVRSADTADLDTIELPFTGIPTPKNVSIAYDTLKQIVTLTWIKADTSLVKSYNIYRRNVGLNTVLVRINTNPITDTVYKDSTGVQDSTYEYTVASVNIGATEGTKSAAVSVKVLSAFVMVDSYPAPDSAEPNNYLFRIQKTHLNQFVGIFTYEVLIMDTSFKVIRRWGSEGFGNSQFKGIRDIAIDNNDFIYVTDCGTNSIKKFDTLGNFVRMWGTTGTGESQFTCPNNIEIDKDNRIFVEDNPENENNFSRIQIFDTAGTFLSTFGVNGSGDGQFSSVAGLAIDYQGYIFIADGYNKKIEKFSSTGNFAEKWTAFVDALNLFSDNNAVIFQTVKNDGTQPLMLYKNDGTYIARSTLGGVVGVINNLIFTCSETLNNTKIIRVYRYPNVVK